MKITYIGAIFNSSGYSDAARNNIMALSRAGVDVEAYPLNFEEFKSDLGWVGQHISGLVNTDPQADIQIIHTIPTVFDQFIRPNKYNIGYTAWETDKLSHDWVNRINRLNEVWVPSKYNYEVFKTSGVHIPVFVMPHTFNREVFEKETQVVKLGRSTPNTFMFYSIFQFHERKDPLSLLRAYLTEFKQEEDVCLLLKTYMFNPTKKAEAEQIKNQIVNVREKLYLKSYPKILLVTNLLSKPQVHGIHKECDCYVSSHRSEGFGVPLAEAMMAGNPVIATNYSGSQDFLAPDTGYPVNYTLTPVYGMPWEAYSGDQTWAAIDVMDLREKMRYVYRNRDEAKQRGLNAQRFVDTNLSWDAIGGLMKSRLEDICAKVQK